MSYLTYPIIIKRRPPEMRSALIVVVFAFGCHVTQASVNEKITKILDRL